MMDYDAAKDALLSAIEGEAVITINDGIHAQNALALAQALAFIAAAEQTEATITAQKRMAEQFGSNIAAPAPAAGASGAETPLLRSLSLVKEPPEPDAG